MIRNLIALRDGRSRSSSEKSKSYKNKLLIVQVYKSKIGSRYSIAEIVL